MKAKKLSGIMAAVMICTQLFGASVPVVAEELILVEEDTSMETVLIEEDQFVVEEISDSAPNTDTSDPEEFIIEEIIETTPHSLAKNTAVFLEESFTLEETMDLYGSTPRLKVKNSDGEFITRIYLAAGETITIEPGLYYANYSHYDKELDEDIYEYEAATDITGVSFDIGSGWDEDSLKVYAFDESILKSDSDNPFCLTKMDDSSYYEIYILATKDGEYVGSTQIGICKLGWVETPDIDEGGEDEIHSCTWDDGVITKAPSCSQEGEILYTCKDECGATKTDILPKKDHTASDPVKENEVKETCTKDGIYDNVVYCSVCDEELSRDTIILFKTGHTDSDPVKENEVKATCTKNGSYDNVIYCSICNEELSRNNVTVLAKGTHNYKSVVTKPTCTNSGYTTYSCDGCGDTYKADETKASGHTYSDWKQATAPTLFKEGSQTRTCSGCGDIQTKSVPKLKGTINAISSKLTMKVNKSIPLNALVKDLTDGDSIDTSKCTSSKTSVAYIKNGKVVAQKNGTAVVKITTKSGVSTSVTVKVQKGTVKTTNLSVSSKKVTITAGKTYNLKPVVTPITSTQKITYKTSNKKVATVSSSGKITTKKAGSATITVKSGNKSVKVRVTVKTPAVESIKLSVTNKTLKVGKSFTLKTTLLPKYSKGTVKYTTSDKKIATVSKTGKVKAKKKGSVTITAKVGNISNTCKITVK